jgi:hypothetical protein
VPVWQSIYEDISDDSFVIISASQDTGGETAAGKIFDDANVTYTAIIDEDHTISTLFNLVNVPSGVWIDEEGQIVRINEGTYAAQHKLGTFEFGSDVYVPALRDWIEKGPDSRYVWDAKQVKKQIIQRSPKAEQAEPAFKLAVYFHREGNEAKARQWWEESQNLNPDSWNFHRQDWSFTPAEATGNWFRKLQSRGKTPYYRSLELPTEEAAE